MSNPPTQSLDRDIADFYQRTPEEARLQQGPFQLEEARTRELIRRFAPPPPAVVLPDIAERMKDADRRETLPAVARMLETEPAVLGTSAHLLAVAQRPSRGGRP